MRGCSCRGTAGGARVVFGGERRSFCVIERPGGQFAFGRNNRVSAVAPCATCASKCYHGVAVRSGGRAGFSCQRLAGRAPLQGGWCRSGLGTGLHAASTTRTRCPCECRERCTGSRRGAPEETYSSRGAPCSTGQTIVELHRLRCGKVYVWIGRLNGTEHSAGPGQQSTIFRPPSAGMVPEAKSLLRTRFPWRGELAERNSSSSG